MHFSNPDDLEAVISHASKTMDRLGGGVMRAAARQEDPAYLSRLDLARQAVNRLQKRHAADNHKIDEAVVFDLVTLDQALEKSVFSARLAVDRITFDSWCSVNLCLHREFTRCFPRVAQQENSKSGSV